MQNIKNQIFLFLENKSRASWGIFLERFLFSLIFFNVFFATLETIESLRFNYYSYFVFFEIFAVLIFLLEYLLRIWTANLKKGYETHAWRYIFTPLMIFDFLVIFIPPMAFFINPNIINPGFLRIFRLIRVFRIIRVSRYSRALERVLAVMKREKDELIAVFFLMMILLLLSSTFLYFFERTVEGTKFTSIPAAFWWGIVTITTVGYGDITPVTPMGQIFASMTAIIGVGVVALPTGLLGASFYQEVTDKREKKFQKMKQQLEEIRLMTEEHGEEIDKFVKKHFEREQKLKEEIATLKKAAGQRSENIENKKEDKIHQIEISHDKLMTKIKKSWQELWNHHD